MDPILICSDIVSPPFIMQIFLSFKLRKDKKPDIPVIGSRRENIAAFTQTAVFSSQTAAHGLISHTGAAAIGAFFVAALVIGMLQW